MRVAAVVMLGLSLAGCATSPGRLEAVDHRTCVADGPTGVSAEVRRFNYNECMRAQAYERRLGSDGGSSSSTMDAAIIGGALAGQRRR